MMHYLYRQIESFYQRHDIFRKPLEKIINCMMEKCKYINGESLERHNWSGKPLKLINIPKNIHSAMFEEDLLNALNLDENEKSTIELLWGDIQLGKRVQACIIMWISVYILKRPVLYIFRNLSIDQKQLYDDIVGTEKYNFNIQFIKTLFSEFTEDVQSQWKDFKLPELKDISTGDIINKLNNKEAINSNDIFCCLMNYAQLAKINSKFNEYIMHNHELVDMTILVDESDLMAPTSSNDRSNINDRKDSTACEILLARIYKKVKYALHITGTAHSLLYNVTTRLNDNTDIQIKISKVHKMKRSDDYFGLFNGSITFNTSIKKWWNVQSDELDVATKPYDIIEDYNINVKPIIASIISRPKELKYSSLLISEEKIRVNQFLLVGKILKDFPKLFIIIYHGNCLRVYLSQQYEQEIKRLSMWDAKQSSTSQRLYQIGGVWGSSTIAEKSEKLPNAYCYFSINTKILNIKLVYKLLRVLFEKSDILIENKTVITITGKYGERGYSFTSDDYDNYSMHLTDQYFVSHASLNCTNASQQMRIQGKINDDDLKNGTMKLTLWTTSELQDIMQNFYVKFIKELEKFIMSCNNWEDIRVLIESVIDNGDFKFGKYMRYIDASKKRKNLIHVKRYDKQTKGYKLIIVDGMTDNVIREWCKESKLPEYICVNEIRETHINEFIDKYGVFEIIQRDEKIASLNSFKTDMSDFRNKHRDTFPISISDPSAAWFNERESSIRRTDGFHMDRLTELEWKKQDISIYRNNVSKNISNSKNSHQWNLAYDCDDNLYISLRYPHTKIMPPHTHDYLKKTPYIVDGDKIYFSGLKKEYTNQEGGDCIDGEPILPAKYYWKTPDGWLCLYDRDKPDIISLNVISPLEIHRVVENVIDSEPVINGDVLLFTQSCIRTTDNRLLRVCIKDIFNLYETWCRLTAKKCIKTQKKFKEELEKINYKEEETKGVDINNNPVKRGYNIILRV